MPGRRRAVSSLSGERLRRHRVQLDARPLPGCAPHRRCPRRALPRAQTRGNTRGDAGQPSEPLHARGCLQAHAASRPVLSGPHALTPAAGRRPREDWLRGARHDGHPARAGESPLRRHGGGAASGRLATVPRHRDRPAAPGKARSRANALPHGRLRRRACREADPGPRPLIVLPRFSIVVPTYRRAAILAECLDAVARLDYPRDRFEAIVVDDGGGAVELPRACAALDIALLSQAHAGPAAARNTGAARARGEFLAFTDDDCRPEPSWLRAMAARIAEAPDRVIGGRAVNALPENPYSTATQLLVDYVCRWHATHRESAFFASNNLVVPAELFRARGGFDASFPRAAGEDREFCHRWARSGGRFAYAPEAVVRHEHRLDLRSFWRQHFTYGRGALRFHRMLAAHGLPARTPASFYLGLVASPLTSRERRPLALVMLLLLSQVATAAGYWRERLARESV